MNPVEAVSAPDLQEPDEYSNSEKQRLVPYPAQYGYGYPPMYPQGYGPPPPGYYPYPRGGPQYPPGFKNDGPHPPPQVQRMTIKTGDKIMEVPSLDTYEAERMRAQKEAEERLSLVKPIKIDFHFFVMDRLKDLRILAEEEVRITCNKGEDENLDPYLVNTNLNHRLARAWEELTAEELKVYAEREEGDQRRFMEEEEVASRHCATLTSRQSLTHPIPVKKTMERRLQEAVDEQNASSPDKRGADEEEDEESPSKRTKVEEDGLTPLGA